jgi:hypothetical protein
MLMFGMYLIFTQLDEIGEERCAKFDIVMGAYHGAQAYKIVGLYLLSKLINNKAANFQPIVYRDDCLGITSSTPRQADKLMQSFIKVFKNHNLSMTIEVG